MSTNASTSPAINLMNEVQTAFEHHLVTLQAQARDPFLAHAQELQACFDLFSDDASKRYYATELVFLMMRTVKPEFAAEISPFKPQDWLAHAQRWNQLVADPKAKIPRNMTCIDQEHKYLLNMLVTTFVCEQYKYAPFVQVEKGEIFLDCGACFGDTALWAYYNGAKKVYSFEPSPSNFPYLQQNLKSQGYDAERCFPYAVGEKEEELSFAAAPGMAGASAINEHGNVKVRCVKLDDFLKEQKIKPTFIKFDIEGAEMGALRGARETITKLKPKMAVCLYHKISDMWEIPLLLKEMVPEYKFYCRKNNVQNEFILYATV